MITFNIITLFPELFDPFLKVLPLKRALEKEIIRLNLIQLRDFAINKRGTVDSKPYGGGVGMILRVEPVYYALESIYTSIENAKQNEKNSIIALAPSGKLFTQQKAEQLTKKENITLICGRYEGMDERIKKHLATEVISTGEYVLSGGELPALTIMETVTRLLPGVLNKEEATRVESFSEEKKKEFAQYTRPKIFLNMEVPEVLLGGDHSKVESWRQESEKSG